LVVCFQRSIPIGVGAMARPEVRLGLDAVEDWNGDTGRCHVVTATALLDFADEAKCQTAASAMNQRSNPLPGKLRHAIGFVC
jgi:hypothetical protein